MNMKDTTSLASGEVVAMSEYHHGPEWGPLLSSHKVKPLYRSPAAFRYPLPAPPVTDPMHQGTLLGHVLECAVKEQAPEEGLFLMPNWGFQSAADKSRWAGLQESLGLVPAKLKSEVLAHVAQAVESQGKILCSAEEMASAQAETRSILLNPNAAELLDGAEMEISFRAHGCKARPDILAGRLMPDLKRSAVSDPRRWRYHAHDMMYPQQMAWYERVLGLCGREVDTWLWIVVDPKPYRLDADGQPIHEVNVYVAESGLRERALNDLENAMHTLAICKRNNEWPDTYSDLYTLYAITED